MKSIALVALNAFTDPGQINANSSHLPLWLRPLVSHFQSIALLAAPLSVSSFGAELLHLVGGACFFDRGV